MSYVIFRSLTRGFLLLLSGSMTAERFADRVVGIVVVVIFILGCTRYVCCTIFGIPEELTVKVLLAASIIVGLITQICCGMSPCVFCYFICCARRRGRRYREEEEEERDE